MVLPETRLTSLGQLQTVLDARVHGRVSSEIRSDTPYSERQRGSGCGQCKRTLQERESAQLESQTLHSGFMSARPVSSSMPRSCWPSLIRL